MSSSGRLNSPPVEQGHHVAGEAQGVHLQQHLAGEEADEEEVGVLLRHNKLHLSLSHY